MKINLLGCGVLSLAFLGCKQTEKTTTTESDAPTVKITAAEPSPHFTEVMSHLHVGGKALHFEDHEGRREFWIDMLDIILNALPEEELPIKVDAAEMVNASGLLDAAASGRSLSKDGDGWLLRHYTSYPKGLPDSFQLIGEKQDFVTASRLPASTDLSLETRIDATLLPENLRKFGKLFGQEKEIEAALKQASPMGVDMETLLSGMDLQILLGIDVEPTPIAQMPVMPKHIFIRVSAKKELVDLVLPLLTDGLGDSIAMGHMQAWPLPAFPGMAEGKPHLLYDGELSFTAVSSLKHFEEIQAEGKKLADQPHFKSATNHFGPSGNLLFYASPEITQAAIKWISASFADSEELRPLIEKLETFSPSKPWSAFINCQENGILSMIEMPYAIDSNATTTLSLLSASSSLFVGARAWKNGSDRAACILQIRNTQQAIRSHQNINGLNIGSPLNWEDIIGPDKFLESKPVCPSGGVYTFVETYPKVGDLACTCSHADHAPKNHEDW